MKLLVFRCDLAPVVFRPEFPTGWSAQSLSAIPTDLPDRLWRACASMATMRRLLASDEDISRLPATMVDKK